MSVFGDFQRVWVQRFPESDLPAAWEEDVRANLAKHKQKVAVLREELEKEEFYVEYLERLLSDVEKHKTQTQSSTSGATRDSVLIDNEQDTRKPDNTNNDDSTPSAPPPEEIASASSSADQCVTEISTVQPSQANNQVADPSNFVTVIEVNGLKGQETESHKKVPPKPPPKTYTESKPTTKPTDAVKEPSVGSKESLILDTDDHYYDSVPPDDEIEDAGEYVYIAANSAGGAGSSTDDVSSSACSTLPMPAARRSHTSSVASGITEPESPGKTSNYVNIDFFMQQRSGTNETRSSSLDSEGEDEVGMDVPPLLRTISMDTEATSANEDPPYASCSSLESATPASQRKFSTPSTNSHQACEDSKAEAERMTMYRCIISSIVDSETIYVECLNVMLQYMKAIKATLNTSQPVITESEFNTVFYKIPELHKLHQGFLDGLKKATTAHGWDGRRSIGKQFHMMATNLLLYGAFLHNYANATDTVRKCSASNPQFKNITSDIRCKMPGGGGQSISLEDLLHKPVARVQKNALVLHDLLKYTPAFHPDHTILTEALAMTQTFLDEFNIIQTKSMFPANDRAQRRLVKNSFIVELSEGHRKLRHLFLFNDVIACAKYKPSGREKFTFELKWFIPLGDIVVLEENCGAGGEPRESAPPNIVALKSQACTVRDQILAEERASAADDKRLRLGGRGGGGEKHRKKLAELEAQLVLASPNLLFRLSNKANQRTMTFFLSSEYERTQWIETIHALQSTCQPPAPTVTVSMLELQTWITACRMYLKTNMGSYLLRSGRDESLLVGDLHLTIKDLTGLDRPTDLYVCVEVDSYGHYFRKARSRLVCHSACPRWNESYVIDLEGSQNLRILVYEDSGGGPRPTVFAKHTQKLSRSWLSPEQNIERRIKLHGDSVLTIALKFVPCEVTLRRVSSAKPGALFGAKIQQVCKRQKRDVPFIVTACIREVERRGMSEVGIYRVSGSASDLTRLKKSFEKDSYEAEQLLKEVDIHSVTGILKLYLRELPEALFTDALYPQLAEAYNNATGNDKRRYHALMECFNRLPQQNQHCIHFILSHLIRINEHEAENKMSLHNLATVFGPTLLRPGGAKEGSSGKQRDPLAAGTVDVMAQAGILYAFLQAHKSSPPPSANTSL